MRFAIIQAGLGAKRSSRRRPTGAPARRRPRARRRDPSQPPSSRRAGVRLRCRRALDAPRPLRREPSCVIVDKAVLCFEGRFAAMRVTDRRGLSKTDPVPRSDRCKSNSAKNPGSKS
jgi:hypothetical protein